MRFSGIIAASLAAVPIVAAHGDDTPMPKVFGLPKHLRARNPWVGHATHRSVAGPQLQARQGGDANGRCGSSGGGASCAAGYCCSSEGYCGTTKEHCAAPDCQINFGPACDGNKTPAGSTTRNDARPQLGSVPYGVVVEACENPKKVAITYDDGPYIYTQDVLDAFAQYNAHATFFITGNNIGKGAIDENWTGVIKNMVAGGHQVASHTWSHQDLSAITAEQRYDQMIKNEMAIRNIIGKYPTYMRPPYSSCNSACLAVMAELGYVVSYFDLDTDDYNQLTTEKIQVAKDNFKKGIDSAGTNGDRLAIAHDIHELTAHNLTSYMLQYLYSQGFTAVTMGECLNDPEANWYRSSTPAPAASSTTRSSSVVPTPTGAPTVDGSCGGTAGLTCIGFTLNGALAQCCSQYGYCGNTDGHCGDTCQAGYGKCGASANTPVSVSSTSSGPAPTPTGATSVDGSCGGTAGYSCIGFVFEGVASQCCSQYGYCGATDGHCGTGCQAGFGKCGIQSVSSSSSSVSRVSSTSSSATLSTSSSSSSSSSASFTPASSSSPSSSSAASSTSSSPARTSTSSSVSSTRTSSSTSASSSPASPTSASSTKASSTSSSSSKVSSTSVSSTKASSSSSTRASSTPAPSTTSSRASTTLSPTSTKTSSASSSRATSSAPSSTSSARSTTLTTKTTSTSSARASATGSSVSTDGRCGKSNGSKTCEGYRNNKGVKVECCSAYSGICGSDAWSCGWGCDDKYGNCWF